MFVWGLMALSTKCLFMPNCLIEKNKLRKEEWDRQEYGPNPGPKVIELFFIRNSAEQEDFSANKYENAKLVGTFVFISSKIFMFSKK